MPTYDYVCPECDYWEEKIHRIKEIPEYFCAQCKDKGKEVKLKKQFSPNRGGFIIKGGSEAINWKQKRYQMKRNNTMEKRQIERYGSGPRIRPNVAGIETDNWSDAAKLAKEAGMNADSYKPMIEKEKHISRYSNVDDRAWKMAKDKNQ